MTPVNRDYFESRGARTRPLRVWLALCLLAALSFPAAAQEAPAVTGVTLEAAEAKLASVQQAEIADETLKTKLIELYTDAVTQLKAAQVSRDTAAKHEDERVGAPDRIKEIEAQLAAPDPEFDEQAIAEAPLSDVSQKLTEAEAKMTAAIAKKADLAQEPGRRSERRRQIPELIGSLMGRLEEAKAQLSTVPDPNAAPELVEARRVQAEARVAALNAEHDALEKELRSYEARSQLLTLRQDLADREAAASEARVTRLRQAVTALRQQAAQQAQDEASQALQLAAELSPEVRHAAEELAAENAALAERRSGEKGLVKLIQAAGNKELEIDAQQSQVSADFTELRGKAETVQFTQAVGLLFRKHLRGLPDVRRIRANVSKRNQTIGLMQFEQIELQEQRRKLADVQAQANELVDGLGAMVAEEDEAAFTEVVTELLAAKRSNLDALIADYDDYVDLLLRLQLKEEKLAESAQAFADYIGERVLWVPSGTPLRLHHLKRSAGAVDAVASPSAWLGAGRNLAADTVAQGTVYLLFLLALVCVAYVWYRLRRQLASFAAEAKKSTCVTLQPTSLALLQAILATAFVPAVLAFIGWRLGDSPLATVWDKSVATALVRLSVVLFLFSGCLRLLRSNGLGRAHFGWPDRACIKLSRQTQWFLPLAALGTALTTMLDELGEDTLSDSAGRLVFMGAMACLLLFVHRVMRPGKGVLWEALAARRGKRGNRLDRFWYLLALAVPLTLLGLAYSGFYFTALRLAWRVFSTTGLVLALVVLRALIERAVLLARRKLARAQAAKRREALRAKGAAAEEAPVEEEANVVDLAAVDANTRWLIRSASLAVMVLGLWAIWADVLPALGILEQANLWPVTQYVAESTPGNGATTVMQETIVYVTLLDLIAALLVAAMTFVLAVNLPNLLEVAILQRLPFAAGERYAITTLVGYGIAIGGAVWGFQLIGLGWGKIQWLVAALGVGLGFGLQEIFANFMSGLILLFERPIRVGDTVTIGGVSGTVSKIRIRATRVVDWDRKELIVPNKEFVTGQLINWTLSDPVLRVIVPVGIAYGSDVEKAMRVMNEVIDAEPLALKEPAPQVLFLGFGDSSLDFELRVFCPNIDSFIKLKHAIHVALDAAFREAGIEIPFPQRDVHVRTAPPKPLPHEQAD